MYRAIYGSFRVSGVRPGVYAGQMRHITIFVLQKVNPVHGAPLC